MIDPESFRKAGERIDDLERSGLHILQDPERFCFGMDAVLLSGFARIREGENVLDLGTGTGILPLLLSAKTKAHSITGLEIQPESADMARRSVEMNGLSDKISIVTGDAGRASEIFGKGSFDAVVSNPPYMIADHGIRNPEEAKWIARHETTADLEDFLRETASVLTDRGHAFYVHRPFRLADLFCLSRENGLEPKRMQLVYPFSDKEPNMVLLECVKGGRPRLTVEKPLIVYERPGVYTREIYDIYGY